MCIKDNRKYTFKKSLKRTDRLKEIEHIKKAIKPKEPEKSLPFLDLFLTKNSKDLEKTEQKKMTQEKEPEYVKTGIVGFDDMFEKGIPRGTSILIAGGAGSGKTIMGLHISNNAARQGKKCLFMSFEESEERLRKHMKNFGWDARKLEQKGTLIIKRFSIFDIRRSLDALMAKSQGELLIDVKPIILPDNFMPDIIIIDSLTAIASAFTGTDTYRSYIEHLFRYFEGLNVTSFLITETEEVPTVFSPTGVEEFLADGVIVLYNIRKGDIRESAIEVLKMRGINHVKKIVAMRIVSDVGIEVYPEQEVFGGIT